MPLSFFSSFLSYGQAFKTNLIPHSPYYLPTVQKTLKVLPEPSTFLVLTFIQEYPGMDEAAFLRTITADELTLGRQNPQSDVI